MAVTLKIQTIKIILFFALINSSIFVAYQGELSFSVRSVLAIIMNLSGMLLLFSYIKKMDRLQELDGYVRLMFGILMFWGGIVIARGVQFDIEKINTLFGHYLMAWTWLSPLAIVFGLNVRNWVQLLGFFKWALLIGGVLAIGAWGYTNKQSLGVLEWFVFLPYLVFMENKWDVKSLLLLAFVVAMYFVATYYASVRANLLFSAILLFFYLIEIRRSQPDKKSGLVRYLILIGVYGIPMVLGGYYLVQLWSSEDVLLQDTRTFLVEELFDDMVGVDRWIGRGAMGTYYSPYFSVAAGDAPVRSVNEIGYLHMVLKGGYLMAALHLLVLAPVSLMGIFHAKNRIARSCGYIILSYLLLWVVSYYPVYSAEYILIWMAAGTIASKKIREMTDEEVYFAYNPG